MVHPVKWKNKAMLKCPTFAEPTYILEYTCAVCVKVYVHNEGSSRNAGKLIQCMCVCVASRRNPSLRRSMVWVGSYKLREGAQRYMSVEHVIKHPEYRAFHGGYENNIALVRLKKKLTLERGGRVSLPAANDNFDASSDCWVAGWGDIENGGKFCTSSR